MGLLKKWIKMKWMRDLKYCKREVTTLVAQCYFLLVGKLDCPVLRILLFSFDEVASKSKTSHAVRTYL